MKNVLVVGAGGALGQTLLALIKQETGWNGVGVAKGSRLLGRLMDNDPIGIDEELDINIDVVVNAAAMTNVDRCEIEREEAWKSNVVLVERLVRYCGTKGAKLVHCSTDNVFDGVRGPYDESAKTNPINYYGRTKLAAENICKTAEIESLIVRTMWLYGSKSRASFVEWVVGEMKAGRPVRVAYDEVGNSTHYEDLAWGIILGIERSMKGIVHIAGRDRGSRIEVAEQLAQHYGLDPGLIIPIRSEELGRAAKRPLDSGLISTRTLSELGFQARGIGECLR